MSDECPPESLETRLLVSKSEVGPDDTLLTCGQVAWLSSLPDFRYPGSRPTEHLPQLQPGTGRVTRSRGVSGMTEGWPRRRVGRVG